MSENERDRLASREWYLDRDFPEIKASNADVLLAFHWDNPTKGAQRRLVDEHNAAVEEIAALKAENIELRKVYSSTCPECGYAGCTRGRKACDTQISELEAEIAAKKEQLKTAQMEGDMNTLKFLSNERADIKQIEELKFQLKIARAEATEWEMTANSWMADYHALKEKYEPMIAVPARAKGE